MPKGVLLTIAPGARIRLVPRPAQAYLVETLAFGGVTPLACAPWPAIVVEGALRAEGRAGAAIELLPEGDWDGISFIGVSRGSLLRHVHVRGAARSLVTCADFSEAALEDVRLEGGAYGVRCGGFARGLLRRARVSGQSCVGALAQNDASVELLETELSGGATGLAATDHARAAAAGCRIEGSAQSAVMASGRARLDLKDSRVERNRLALDLRGLTRGQVRRCVLSGNGDRVHRDASSRIRLIETP